MDIRTLRYFVYIAEARSFSRASSQLRIAQPALSRQVQKLESELGVELVLRTGRQLELTEAGVLLLQRARSLMRQLSQITDDVRSQGSKLRGRVTIGVSPATCELLSPLLVRECAKRYPDLRLSFVEGFSGYIFDRLINHELTLCLMHNPPQQQGVETQPLLTESMYLVGPAAGADGLPPVSPDMDIADLPLVLPSRTHSLRMLIERAVAAHGGSIQVSVQVDGFTTTKSLVLAGVGYTILPYSAIHQQVKTGQLTACRLREPEISWTLSIAHRTDQRTVRSVAAMRDIIVSGVSKLVSSGELGEEAVEIAPDPTATRTSAAGPIAPSVTAIRPSDSQRKFLARARRP